jgi:hypothetical protein
MTAENFDQVMGVLLERRPYQVFTVELNGGDRFEVDFPTALSFRGGVAVFLAPGNIPGLFDHDSVNKIIAASANTSLDRPEA